MKFLSIRIFVLLSLLIGSCSESHQKNQKSDALFIATTTGMLGDAVKNIVGEKAKIESLMGPGVDPHLYKAAQSDLRKLSDADVVIYNGLYLEGKMENLLEKLGQMKKTISVGNQIDAARLINTGEGSGSLGYDPHIWFDVSLWIEAVKIISSALQEQDAANASVYAENTHNYLQELETLHEWVKNEIERIPAEQRMLITSHDAFGYFGKAYHIEVHGLQGVSTSSDYGLQDVTRLVNLIVKRKVKSVFIESSVAPRSLEAVVEGCKNHGHEIRIGGTLYSDAMGEPGTPEGTYIGMVRVNVNTIVNALK